MIEKFSRIEFYKSKNYQKLINEESSEKSSEKILILIKKDPKISALELSKKLDLTSRAIEKNISKLKEEGRLKRTGSAKTGHWEVISK